MRRRPPAPAWINFHSLQEVRPTSPSNHISVTFAHAGGSRRGAGARAGALATGLALLLLASCGSGSGSVPTGPSSAGGSASSTASSTGSASPGTAGGSAPVVTVPGLESASGAAGGESGSDAGHGSTPPATGSARRTVTVTATATPGGTGDSAASSVVGTGATSAAGPDATSGSDPTSGLGAPASTDATPPAGRSTTSAPASTTRSGGSPVTVDLSGCPGCTVIATHRAVAGSLSAALATNARGAVLLSVHADGGVAGAINVPYGATFPTPSGKSLPCDDSGRCIVNGRQSDGHAILSAFHLDPGGSWRDVSGDDGFPSATATGLATDVDGDGLLDIAVQESAGDLTDWMVLTWSGGHFTVLGCAVASGPVPPASELSRDVCLS